VLALERCLIPAMSGGLKNKLIPAFSPEEAVKYALARIATNITSGWFREFANSNFEEIMKATKTNDYFGKFLAKQKSLKKVEKNVTVQA
jgi:hypothetical protein